MTGFEIFLSAGSVATAIGGLAYVAHVVRTSGRDRPHDPERVDAMVKNAPLERLDNVLVK